MVDISVIITAHREGILSGATIQSAKIACQNCEVKGIKTEVIVVLDRANRVTKDIFLESLPGDTKFITTDYGDPGLARNSGINEAEGQFSTFLDADDLWSENWLVTAHEAAKDERGTIWHSHCNLVFGNERNIWWHIDSDGAFFDDNYLRWANYWDAMSFAATDIYRSTQFRGNDFVLGVGHEDWHWNVETIRKGIPHKPVQNTIHFKRRRKESQMSVVAKNDALIWPS